MKRKICLILSCIMLLVAIVPIHIFADNVSLYTNNTMSTYTSFIITDSGEARVAYEYDGYEGITAGAVITIKIEKRNFFFFWDEIVEDCFVVPEVSGFGCNYYQLTSKGTYRCTVTYRVGGTGGEDDVLTFEDTKTY